MLILNVKTGMVHRDPGCSRIGLHAGARSAGDYVDVEARPPGSPTCFYCYSRAGRRRYPGTYRGRG